MNPYEEKLKKWMHEHNVPAEHIHFERSVHTVEEACREAGAQPDDFVKSICMVGSETVVAMVLGSDRASTERVAKALNIERPHVASPEEALEKTGYLVGGTPPFGYKAKFLIDPKIMLKDIVYAGGGSPTALIRIDPKEIQKFNNGIVVRVRK
ncbi:MAG: YbaK/EbsC family protein [Candidatus Aenigmatarchaeota archaeon]